MTTQKPKKKLTGLDIMVVVFVSGFLWTLGEEAAIEVREYFFPYTIINLNKVCK